MLKSDAPANTRKDKYKQAMANLAETDAQYESALESGDDDEA